MLIDIELDACLHPFNDSDTQADFRVEDIASRILYTPTQVVVVEYLKFPRLKYFMLELQCPACGWVVVILTGFDVLPM
jgi:hypothetical protein